MLSSFKLECGGVRCKKNRLKNQEKELGAEDWRELKDREKQKVWQVMEEEQRSTWKFREDGDEELDEE